MQYYKIPFLLETGPNQEPVIAFTYRIRQDSDLPPLDEIEISEKEYINHCTFEDYVDNVCNAINDGLAEIAVISKEFLKEFSKL